MGGIKKAAGRPREEATGPALMAAARRLVAERGYTAVSIGMIASEVGVGRQTLYRRWASKAELILDAFFENAGRYDAVGDGPMDVVLASFLRNLFEGLREDGPAIRNLIASAQSDQLFLANFRERFVEPRSRIAAAIIQRGVERGEIPADVDLDILMSAMHGAFWYELLQGKELDHAFADRLVLLLMNGMSPRRRC